MRRIWQQHQKPLMLAAGFMMIMLLIAIVSAASQPTQRTRAEPPTEREVTFDLEKNRAYSAEDGIVIIPAEKLTVDSGQAEEPQSDYLDIYPQIRNPSLSLVNTQSSITDEPEEVWTTGIPVGSNDYTMPEAVQMPDGSIGMLTVPKLSLAVSVYETEDEMEAMIHGLAHFKTTSAWEGNVALCGHNINFDLTDGHFKHLYTLVPGDIVSYATALGNRAYAVETVAEIAETDWSYLGRTGDNRLTLITCISGRPTARLVVQAVAI